MSTHPDRRTFVVTALGTGFALAVRPVTAATITTSAEGLDAGEVKIPSTGGNVPAYFARPKRAGKHATVLVVHEVFGVHEHIKDVCRRLAKAGYLAVAPDLYARQGDVSQLTDIKEILSKVASKVPDAQVLADLDATAAWAAKSGHGDPARLGITGFCWGGRITWLYAAHAPKLKAGVAWYGRIVGDVDPLHPKHPIDVVDELKAPVLGLYGEKDQAIPMDSVERMRKALAASKNGAASGSTIQTYANAGHAFAADYRPSYVPDAAADGWARMLVHFANHGVKP